MIDPTTLARDAAWLPHRLLDGGKGLRFVHADRDAQRAATFLDDAYLGEARECVDVAMASLPAISGKAAPMHFIFHSAFACSTLLARAMDLPGRAMGLKEPIILNDATALLRRGTLKRDTLDRVLRLLERPLGAGESIIVKPSNAANPLMTELLQLRPDSRTILLYRALPAFLRSIAKRGMFGRIWGRRLLSEIRPEAPFDAGFSEREFFIQTDLQAAAFGWLIQHAQFAALAKAIPNRIRLLDAGELLANRHSAFGAAAGWFGIPLSPDEIDTVIDGPMFAEDAKRLGERFGAETREDPAPVDETEIEMVVVWATAVAKHVGLPLTFGPRLIPTE